jgi:zinc protease
MEAVMLIDLMLAAALSAAPLAAETAPPPASALGTERGTALLAEAPSAPDTATTSYEVAGLRVIHRPLAANELVAVNLYLLGGAGQLTAETAGIELMLLRASEFGTDRYPGREARLALARTGSRITLYSEPDWTVFAFRGIRTEFDSTWSVFADRVMHPTLDPTTVEVVRRRMLRERRARQNHPDALLRMLADSVVFQGHPYQHGPGGTERSLQAITKEALRGYLDSEMVTSRMLLVVVGNISRAQVEDAIDRTFARLPRGEYVRSLPPIWSAPRPSVTTHQRQIPTNYILGYFAGPQSDSRDYTAFRVATMLLGGISSYRIRDNGLSYAASSPVLERGASGGGVDVTTTWPDTTMKVFNSTITLLQENTLDRRMLQRYYNGFITNYYSENESNTGQADFLARYELLHGDWRLSTRYMDDLKGVQGFHVRRAARQYMRNIQYVYIGDPSRVPEREMTRF